jgi:hypothetical protein
MRKIIKNKRKEGKENKTRRNKAKKMLSRTAKTNTIRIMMKTKRDS